MTNEDTKAMLAEIAQIQSLQAENANLKAEVEEVRAHLIQRTNKVVEYELINAELLRALRGLEAKDLVCTYDSLNPCWNNRPSDIIGTHWGNTASRACPKCICRAAIAKNSRVKS